MRYWEELDYSNIGKEFIYRGVKKEIHGKKVKCTGTDGDTNSYKIEGEGVKHRLARWVFDLVCKPIGGEVE